MDSSNADLLQTAEKVSELSAQLARDYIRAIRLTLLHRLVSPGPLLGSPVAW